MKNGLDDALTVNATGIQVTGSAVSAVVPIPNAADGNRARFVRVCANGSCYLRPGGSGTTVSTSDGLYLSSFKLWVLLNVQGFTHIAYISSGTPLINITPLEAG
jgi:hypothetical protein